MRNVCFYCPDNIFQPGGGATVAENILKTFDNGLRNDIIFSKKTSIPITLYEKYNVRRIWYPSNYLLRIFFDLFIAPFILLQYKNYRVICLNSIVPLLYPFHLEVFFQMRMFHFEELDTYSKKIKNKLGILSLLRSKKIYVASQDHKNDLMSHLSFNPDKIKVAYLGFDFNNYTKQNLKSDNSLIKDNYWLFISIFRPYKNIDGLIETYGRLFSKYKEIPDLIMIGDYPSNYYGIDNYKNLILKTINKYNLSKKVIFLGLKSHKESMQYLANASLFIFPSKFEGFGLPILEAMALGVPVLSSNFHSLPEIGGDTIKYFNPDLENDFYNQLEEIYLNGYNKNITEAEARSKLFTWERTCSIIANEE